MLPVGRSLFVCYAQDAIHPMEESSGHGSFQGFRDPGRDVLEKVKVGTTRGMGQCRQLVVVPPYRAARCEAGPSEWVTVACVTPWPYLAIQRQARGTRSSSSSGAGRERVGKGARRGVVANES